MAVASLFPCTQRCTRSSMLPACLLLSRHSPNRQSVVPHIDNLNQLVRKARQSDGVFQRPYSTKQSKDGKTRKKHVGGAPISSNAAVYSRGGRKPGSSGGGEESAFQPASESPRQWSGRRRNPRVNGADLYVARITKNGLGCAKPCWRCIEWCRWAGVKRIFHYDGEIAQFQVVKVNATCTDMVYETHSDVRLYTGMTWW